MKHRLASFLVWMVLVSVMLLALDKCTSNGHHRPLLPVQDAGTDANNDLWWIMMMAG